MQNFILSMIEYLINVFKNFWMLLINKFRRGYNSDVLYPLLEQDDCVTILKIEGSSFSSVLRSPLEQFDDCTWIYTNKNFEGSFPYRKDYVFFDIIDPLIENTIIGGEPFSYMHPAIYSFLYENSVLYGNLGGFSLISLIVIVYVVAKYKDFFFVGNTFSVLFLIGFIHIFTGLIFFFWFYDMAIFNIIPSYLLMENGGFFPIVNFSIFFDENLISFLIAFFFFSGSEESEDEDFLLEEEESDFIDDVVAPLFVANLGKNVEDNGPLYLKVSAVFSFVLLNNLMGMLPYSDTGTSSLILTFWVALSVFASLIFLMIQKQGITHFFSLFMPSGCPLPLIFLLIPIEFISYSFRLVSLSVRLFANMMAGHTLLKVIVGFSWTMILLGDFFLIANLFPILILFVLTFMELGVAMIQAYVFTILICMYLKDVFQGH